MENNNFALLFGHLAVYLFVWVFAITAQSAATAWMSNRYGDDTARNAGRVTLNPFVQADLIGTILLPVLGFVMSWFGGGIPLVAWGKQVPIDGDKWRNPKLAGVMVALSSTFVSIALAVVCLLLLKMLFVTGLADADSFVQTVLRRDPANGISWIAPFTLIFWYGMVLNIALTVFSLLPFPPFAGGAVLSAVLPASFRPMLNFFQQYGLIIAIALIYFRVLNYVIDPILFAALSFLGFGL